MRQELEELRREHRCFEYLLDILERQLRAVQEGESPDYPLMAEILDYLTAYPDVYHHPWEDRLNARLVTLEPGVALLERALHGDHLRLARDGRRLAAAIADIMAGAFVERAELVQPGLSYVRCYRSHLQREERDLFPLAVRLLSEADWAELARDAQASPPPWHESLGGRYAVLAHWIATEGGPGHLPDGSGRCPVCAAA